MGKYKVVSISIMLILLVSLVLPACAPAKPVATPPAAPVATPPAAPVVTPPATPVTSVPAPKALSFEPQTYTRSEDGFTWKYPNTWEKTENYNNLVIKVLASKAQGADNAGIIIIPQSSDYAKAVKGEIDSDPGLLGTKVDVSAAKAVKLADGKTDAFEATATAKIMGLYPLYISTVGINKGGKTIIAWAATLGNAAKQGLADEIAHTLAVQ